MEIIGKVIGTIIGALLLPVLAYWLTYETLHYAFTAIGFYKVAGLVNLANLITNLSALAAGGYIAYISIIGPRRKKAGIGQASTTSKTGRKVKASVYTIETHTPAVPRIHVTNPFRGVLILGEPERARAKV